MPELTEGATYRFIGDSAAYRGRTGVLSGLRRQGRNWFGYLSNHAEWMKSGLPPQIEVMGHELELVCSPAAKPTAQPQPSFVDFDGEEQDLVEDICTELTRRGYLVCVVGQRKAKGSGTTVGYPDMSFRCPQWPRGMACLIEIKNADGEMTREQRNLHNQGWSYEARSVAEVIECLSIFSSSIGGKL